MKSIAYLDITDAAERKYESMPQRVKTMVALSNLTTTAGTSVSVSSHTATALCSDRGTTSPWREPRRSRGLGAERVGAAVGDSETAWRIFHLVLLHGNCPFAIVSSPWCLAQVSVQDTRSPRSFLLPQKMASLPEEDGNLATTEWWLLICGVRCLREK